MTGKEDRPDEALCGMRTSGKANRFLVSFVHVAIKCGALLVCSHPTVRPDFRIVLVRCRGRLAAYSEQIRPSSCFSVVKQYCTLQGRLQPRPDLETWMIHGWRVG